MIWEVGKCILELLRLKNINDIGWELQLVILAANNLVSVTYSHIVVCSITTFGRFGGLIGNFLDCLCL